MNKIEINEKIKILYIFVFLLITLIIWKYFNEIINTENLIITNSTSGQGFIANGVNPTMNNVTVTGSIIISNGSNSGTTITSSGITSGELKTNTITGSDTNNTLVVSPNITFNDGLKLNDICNVDTLQTNQITGTNTNNTLNINATKTNITNNINVTNKLSLTNSNCIPGVYGINNVGFICSVFGSINNLSDIRFSETDVMWLVYPGYILKLCSNTPYVDNDTNIATFDNSTGRLPVVFQSDSNNPRGLGLNKAKSCKVYYTNINNENRWL